MPTCNENLKRVLKVLKISEWSFQSVLSDVVRDQGGRRYNEMTEACFAQPAALGA